jgi:3-oxoacyl-[acyl-carrier protein] reductase
MRNKFANKVVLVTGASRGIGRVVAEEFASYGAKVVVNYNSNESQAEEVVAGIRSKDGDATAIQANIGRVAEVKRLFDTAIQTYGTVDILVNNAGSMITKPIEQFTEEEFDLLFDSNVKGTFFTCQQAALHMRPQGRIINFSTSVTGSMFANYSVYAGTKGAVEQFTRQLAKEFGPKGITINAIAPGPINTELFMNGKSQEVVDNIVRMNSFNRLGETSDITGTVLFLASEEAGWMTGQTIRVNGGYV